MFWLGASNKIRQMDEPMTDLIKLFLPQLMVTVASFIGCYRHLGPVLQTSDDRKWRL
jgi:hypothetical protein